MRPIIALWIVLGLLAGWPSPGRTEIEAVGVYEFKIFTPNPAKYNWLGRGFQATITTKLSNIPELKGKIVDVLGRSDDLSEQAFSLTGATEKEREVGRMISASHIIGGELQLAEEFGVHVTARLRAVDRNTPLYGEERSAEKIKGIFKLQGEIARKIAESLLIALNESLSGSLERPETSSLTAYQYYLIAKDAPAEDVQAKITNYQLALEHDPEYVYALVNLAQTYYTFFRKDEAKIEEAEVLCLKASQIDPAYGDTYYLLGNLFSLREDPEKAIEAYSTYLRLMGENNPFPLVRFTKAKIQKLRKKRK